MGFKFEVVESIIRSSKGTKSEPIDFSFVEAGMIIPLASLRDEETGKGLSKSSCRSKLTVWNKANPNHYVSMVTDKDGKRFLELNIERSTQ